MNFVKCSDTIKEVDVEVKVFQRLTRHEHPLEAQFTRYHHSSINQQILELCSGYYL